jgi:hypothetical protein
MKETINKKIKILVVLAITILGIWSMSSIVAAEGDYKSDPSSFAKSYEHVDIDPVWTEDGKLKQPRDFRRWIFIGAPLTPHALNGGRANFPEFHNVYVQPKAFQYYRDHGKWPEGTMMAKELQLVGGKATEEDGSRYEPSGRGYFPGKVNGMDVAVKDSTRFAESKNWGYFNFGHHAAPYAATAKAAPIAACAACHIANASEDMVYMDLYRPIVEPLPLPLVANTADLKKPTFDADGKLNRPDVSYRQWVYVGTPLTPNDLNPPAAPFPEFHSVYMHPSDFDHWKRTGAFQDGTVFIKELITVGSKQAVSVNGYFMGEFSGLEATVKDSTRFKDEPGYWAYFDFGQSYPLADKSEPFPAAACNACHETSAADDFVFTQYYPILRAAKGGKNESSDKISSGKTMAPGDKDFDSISASMSGAMASAMEPSASTKSVKSTVPTDDNKLHEYLRNGEYKKFTAQESENHPSAGPHTKYGLPVRVFLDPKLDASLKAGNSTHPAGSGVVKEMYNANGELEGWAVAVKTQKDSEGGKGWFWYEVTSTAAEAKPYASGNGIPLCFGCHSTGSDYVLTKYPLK